MVLRGGGVATFPPLSPDRCSCSRCPWSSSSTRLKYTILTSESTDCGVVRVIGGGWLGEEGCGGEGEVAGTGWVEGRGALPKGLVTKRHQLERGILQVCDHRYHPLPVSSTCYASEAAGVSCASLMEGERRWRCTRCQLACLVSIAGRGELPGNAVDGAAHHVPIAECPTNHPPLLLHPSTTSATPTAPPSLTPSTTTELFFHPHHLPKAATHHPSPLTSLHSPITTRPSPPATQ